MKLSTARAALAALSFTIAAGAWAQKPPAESHKSPAATDVPIPDIPYTRFTLKNGLTVIVHEDHKLPVVAINTWYHVGSKNEKPGKTGFAHLFEHLMFSGSENFNQTYISAVMGIGATDLNGTTNKDRTNYFQNVPTSMLDYVLFAESDRMGHLLGVLDQKKLDLQRGVVQNEKRSGENQPYGIVRNLVPPNTYPPEHPYSWTVIGSMADLDAAAMKDVQEWFKTYYGPNNTILVLAGDITPEQAKQKVEKYYGDIPPGPPIAKQAAWPAKMEGTHRGIVQDRVPQARIYRFWNVPGIATEEDALFDVTAQILGGGKTSRLYKRLVRQDQLAVAAVAFNASSEIGGQFQLQLTARPGVDVRKMEAAADQELQALLKNGPTAAEVELARTTILADYARRAERIGGFGGKSDLLAQCETFQGNPACWKDYVRIVKTVTPAKLQKAMKEWLGDGDYVLEVQPYPDVEAAKTTLDRKAAPELGKAQVLKMPELQKLTLSNGMKVLVAERHTAPVVNLSLLVDSGYAADPQDLPGLTTLVLDAMEEGTPTRSATKISEELERLGATLETHANLDGSFIAMNALKNTLGPALDIYADVILHPAFPQGEVERLRKEQLAAIAREKSDPEAMALRVMPALLYGSNHAYSRPLTGTGTEAAITKVTRDDLLKYHRTWFRPNNATLLVVGDTTADQIKPLLEKSFKGWAAGDVPKKSLPNVKPPEKVAVYLLDRPGSQQSVIVGGQVAQPADATELVQMQLVNNVLGGMFSSRMNMNLREDKHWSYGVYSQLRAALGQRPLLSISAVQSDKTSEAFKEVVTEYAGVAGARPITAAELKLSADRETLALPGRFETTAQLSTAYANVLQYRLPEDYYTRFTPTALAFTPDQANALARKFLLPNQQVWVVVGDMAKVESGIRALNLGEVHRIDVDGKILK